MSNKGMNQILEGLNRKERESAFKNMEKDIEKAKKKLMKKEPYENFGDKEERQIRDKYSDLETEDYAKFHSMLNSFYEWCANYDGR